MTNYDRLHAMTADELARELCDWYKADCKECPGYRFCVCMGGHGNGLKKWMKMEVEGDKHD